MSVPERVLVLIVDDDALDRMAVRRALQYDAAERGDLDAEIVEVESCAQARHALETQEFACIFLDAHLPDGDGLDLLSEFRSQGIATPIILLTGQRDERSVMELMQAGAADYVPKSILTPDFVGRSLRAALRFRQARREAQGAQDALRLRERAIAAASNGIVIADARLPDCPLIYANDAFLAMTGYEKDEILGRNCRFLQGKDTDPAAIARIRDAVRAEQSCQVFVLNYRKDGTPFWNEVTVSPLRDEQGRLTHFIGIQTDITARIAAENERAAIQDDLATERARLQAVQDSITDGLILCDLTGNVLSMNPAALRIHGFAEPQEAQHGVNEFAQTFELCTLDGDVVSVQDWPLARLLRGERFIDMQYLLRRLDTRTSQYVSCSGAPVLGEQNQPLLIVLTIRDITRIKQTEMRLAETLEALNQEYEKEHRIAEALQRSLLNKPSRRADGLEVETVYKPALEEAAVGGDYFDVFSLEGGKLALVVGDVSGKGLEAASRTAEIKFTLRAYLREYGHAAATLSRLNIFLCESKLLEDQPTDEFQEYFVALTLAVADLTTGELEIAVGGAEPPMILRSGGTMEEANAHGMPLGISTKAEYEPFTSVLEPGDLLLIATDGMTEARHGNAFLGNDGLATLALEARREATLEKVGQKIFEGAERFAHGRLHDDVCLLLARRK